MPMKNVLVVEDDPNILDLIKIHLTDLNCHVSTSGDGADGLQKALSQDFDLILLDIMLPSIEGLEICRQIRAKEIQTPILILSAKSEELDKILGLEIGADDYLTKPFSVRELIARVKAIFRRSAFTEKTEKAQQQILRFDELYLDLDKRITTLNDVRIDLSPKEFELLVLLAQHPGKSYSRAQLLTQIWGYDFNGYEHTVNAHINRLRSKIEVDTQQPKFILTTWGVGYRFTDEV